ncbi:hypothetical protein HYDPIDRAFT_116949 [Hydnomerulius pinastri MD-312]|uniref:Unplaced genomic scaffold scaffold_36, whole genome shotgun sequence n=1 Tax=Hydnomerulius pinastri MD-312 TaxID=994086 RepID=A0A0C9V542_9AGAM|nr:hypothetical protein HYDPIDRAFT_116949 [Hydnomerulius pinastri MD-312]
MYDSLPLAALSLGDPNSPQDTEPWAPLCTRSTHSQSRVLRTFARPSPADVYHRSHLSPLDDLLGKWPSAHGVDIAACDPFSFPAWATSLHLRDRGNFAANPHCSLPRLPALEFPSSPSDTCSSISTDITPSPVPDTIRVVCDVPLLAPRPLPYHSPTFLQFDLPDTDEDLSHPPYTHRPSKRKREVDSEFDDEHPRTKRRAGINSWRSRVHHRSWDDPLVMNHSHRRSGNDRWQP